jgi:uncharacterized surface protein with fasciclin (FAS1) repeats
MKKLQVWIVAAMIVMGLSVTLAESSTAVDIEAQGQQAGTVTDYLKANVFSPMPVAACYDHDMTSGQFTCLTTLLEKTGLDKTLAEKGPYTLFAPTDEAFKALAATMTPEDFTKLLDNKTELTKILSYHVLPAKKTLSDLFTSVKDNAVSVATVEKSNLTLNFEGADKDKTNTTIGFAHSDAKVLDGQTVVDNGVIIPIDHVLMPATSM